MRKMILIALGAIFFTMGVGFIEWRHLVQGSSGLGRVLGANEVADRLKNDDQSSSQVRFLSALRSGSTSVSLSTEVPIMLQSLNFRLPPGYEIQPLTGAEPSVDQVLAIARRNGFRRLVVAATAHSTVDDVSAVAMRRRSPERYREENTTVAGLPAISFDASTPDRYEKVFFVQHDTFVTSFSIITESVFALSLAEQELMTVVNSVQWLP